MQRGFLILSTLGTLALAAPAAPPVAGYARWFDASTLGVSHGASVTNWPDLSGNGANATVPIGNASPTFVANAGTETGLGALHFTAGGGSGSSGALRFTRDSSIRTVFSVFKGNSFLLTDSDLYQFHRPNDGNPASPLFTGWARDNNGYNEDGGHITYPTTAANTGSTYVNGTLIQPFDDRASSFAMPTSQHNGYNLVEVLSGNPLQADSFNKDRIYHSGDQYQAEVILYDRVLTEAERVSVETYLMDKWFGAAETYKDILSFNFGALGAANISGTHIFITVPFGTDVTKLAPTYTLSPLATALPLSSSSHDFTNPVDYTVTAKNGSTKVYRVTVWVSSTGDYRGVGYQYLSPLPGAEYTSAQTKFVLLRFKDILPSVVTNLSDSIQVTGASSGIHSGTTKIASDNRTVIFQMTNTFQSGELVTVNLTPQTPSNAVQSYHYQFMISDHMPGLAGTSAREVQLTEPAVVAPATPAQVLPKQSLSLPVEGADLTGVQAQASSVVASPGKTGIMPNGVSVPSDFPHISITTHNNPCPDPIFIENRSGWYSGTRCYNVIFDNNGSPIWYQRMPDERRDMKVQPNGILTMLARDKGQYFYSLDTHYEKIAEYWTTNGYSVDEHEFQMEADGTYYLIGLNYEVVDLSRYVSGAGTSVGVTENCIQKFTADGDLIFQWRAWDHLDPAGQAYVVGATDPGDFPHMNAIAVDTDGHILLSSRNTSEVTKINADTGEIIWRLGGTHNQFTFVNDPLNGQTSQHAIRPLGNNHYTLFDNGNGHSPQASRAVEYELNPETMTATLVWKYPATPTTSLFSYYMGNCQRLSNGNTLINWVLSGYPKLTEVRPDGVKAFEMNWVGGDEAYRVWRCPWQGVAIRPYLILEAYPDNVTLLFNQFGDTDIATYRIYGGTSPNPSTLLATSTTTMKQLSNLTKGQTYYFRVTAVNHDGVEGAFSNEESVVANNTKPGQNLLANGDFSGGKTSWSTAVTSPAAMTWTITSGYSSCTITNGGVNLADLQLMQTGIPLVFGNKYVLAFDAKSNGSRSIETKVQNSTGSLNYSGAKVATLSSTFQRFSQAFTMTAASDFNSMVVFRWGALGTRPVYIDNVVLFSVPPGDFNQDGKVDLLDLKLMSAEWRKVQSGLSTDLNADGKVDFKDIGIMGDNWSASP